MRRAQIRKVVLRGERGRFGFRRRLVRWELRTVDGETYLSAPTRDDLLLLAEALGFELVTAVSA